MAVIPYRTFRLPAAGESLSAIFAVAAEENLLQVEARLHPSAGACWWDVGQGDSSVLAFSAFNQWVTCAVWLLWNDDASNILGEIFASVEVDGAAEGVFVRLVGAGTEPVFLTEGEHASVALRRPAALRPGWNAIELQVRSVRASDGVLTTMTNGNEFAVELSGGPWPPGTCFVNNGNEYVILGPDDVAGWNRYWPPNPLMFEDFRRDTFVFAGASLRFDFGAVWAESPVRGQATTRPGDPFLRTLPNRVARTSGELPARRPRTSVGGRVQGGSVGAFTWWGRRFEGGGDAWHEVALLRVDEAASVRVGVLWSTSYTGPMHWRVLDGTDTVRAAVEVEVQRGATARERRLDWAMWWASQMRVERPLLGCGDWFDGGEALRAVEGAESTGMRFVELFVPTPAGVQGLRIEAQWPEGGAIHVWAVGASPQRALGPVEGVLPGPATAASLQWLVAPHVPYALLRRDMFSQSWDEGTILQGAKATHRTTPVRTPLGWGVEIEGQQTEVLVEIAELPGLTPVDAVVVTLPATSGTARVERLPVLAGDTSYLVKMSPQNPGSQPSVRAIRAYELADEEDVVITFGGSSANVPNYEDLPTDVREGAMARHWTTGVLYRLWKGGAVPVWVPARIYGVDGSGLGMPARILGDEADATELGAHGWPSIVASGDANVGVVYEGTSVLLKCSGATLGTNVVGASSVTVSADITGWTSATRWWVFADVTVVNAIANGHARWCRARDGVRNVALGSNGGGTAAYFDWANNTKSGFANQVLFAATGNTKPASTRRRYEYAWEGEGNRTLLHIDHEPEGGIDRGTLTADGGAAAWTLRAEAANNLRTNLRLHRVYLVTW